MSKPADTPTGSVVISNPWWEKEWSNVKRRKETGENRICEWRLKKKKARYLAKKLDITPRSAAERIKNGEATVPDEVVL